MMTILPKCSALCWALIAAAMTLCGCSSTLVSSGPFYPGEPAPPRLQYLTSLSSAEDVAGRSVLRDFLIGSSPERLVKPSAVAFEAERLLVADGVNDAYAVLDLKAKRLSMHTGANENNPRGVLKTPLDVKVDSDGTRYVTDSAKGAVAVFDSADRYLRSFAPEDEFRPIGLVVAEDRLFVTNIKGQNVSILDKKSGALLGTIGSGELMWPTAIARSPDGTLYVLDSGRFTVLRFSPDGELLCTYGKLGDRGGEFGRPKGITLDRDGILYVTDGMWQNIQLYDQEGNFLMAVGGTGAEAKLVAPAGIAVDYQSAPFFQRYAAPGFQLDYVVAVADQMLSRINIYGFGRMDGVAYDGEDSALAAATH